MIVEVIVVCEVRLWALHTYYGLFAVDSNIQQATGICEHAKVPRPPVQAIKYTSNSQRPQIQQQQAFLYPLNNSMHPVFEFVYFISLH